MGSSQPYDRPGLETAFAQELRTMKFSKQIGLYTVSFLLGIFYPVTGFASTPQAEITHLVIKNTADSLLVDMKIDSEFTPEMRTAVLKLLMRRPCWLAGPSSPTSRWRSSCSISA